jgi:hypothetical protein
MHLEKFPTASDLRSWFFLILDSIVLGTLEILSHALFVLSGVMKFFTKFITQMMPGYSGYKYLVIKVSYAKTSVLL